MVLGELEVLHRRQLNVTVIVLNDASLSLIKLKQDERQGGHGAVGYSPKSFAGFASAIGIESVTVRNCSERTAGLTQSSDRPFLIDTFIDGWDNVAIKELALG
jgi:thiamine pyrophosphate-dependent acetolactate synthase large subunit-like protein